MSLPQLKQVESNEEGEGKEGESEGVKIVSGCGWSDCGIFLCGS